ncbi:MAG: N-acetyltransferase [Rhodospirillaceae bacterium]|nr:N-acetyltransferase [Rhodospirillaceae bacterium]MDD9925247.1 N-acetyltransferase [Rhodospirillaceae bacterium]
MSEMRIRVARLNDADAIAKVYVETWRSAYAGLVPDDVLTGMSESRQRRQWKAQIASGDTVMVAEHPEYGIVGMGSCGLCRDWRFAGSGEIYTLYVLPDWQDQGHGRDLLTAMLRAMRSAGFDGAVLWVLAGNPSRFFYEAMGGRQVAQREERLWQTVLPELAYQWRPLPQPLLLGRSAQDDDTLHDGGGS